MRPLLVEELGKLDPLPRADAAAVHVEGNLDVEHSEVFQLWHGGEQIGEDGPRLQVVCLRVHAAGTLLELHVPHDVLAVRLSGVHPERATRVHEEHLGERFDVLRKIVVGRGGEGGVVRVRLARRHPPRRLRSVEVDMLRVQRLGLHHGLRVEGLHDALRKVVPVAHVVDVESAPVVERRRGRPRTPAPRRGRSLVLGPGALALAAALG